MGQVHDDVLKHKLGLFSADRSNSAYMPVNGDSESLQHRLDRHYFAAPSVRELATASKKIKQLGFGVVIPMRERGPKTQQVLEVLTKQLPANQIVVVNDSSDDAALECVRGFKGVRLIFRDDVLDCLDWKRLFPIINVRERPVGKGMAVLAGYLIHYALKLSGARTRWIFQNDSEIAEYSRYQCLQHLAAGITQTKGAQAVKTAKFGRTNERSMCMRSALGLMEFLPNVDPEVAMRARHIFERTVSDKWIQTGEFALLWHVAMNRPFATGYLEESLTALFCADYFAKNHRGYTLKVANPNPRLDGANDERKEAIMQQQVSNFWLAMAFFKKPVAEWTVADIKRLNRGIMSQNIAMAWIAPNDGPCQAEAVRNDRILPSVSQLINGGYVNMKALRKLVT